MNAIDDGLKIEKPLLRNGQPNEKLEKLGTRLNHGDVRSVERETREGFMGFIANRPLLPWHPNDRSRFYTNHYQPVVLGSTPDIANTVTSVLAVPRVSIPTKEAVDTVLGFGFDVVDSNSANPGKEGFNWRTMFVRLAEPSTEQQWRSVDEFAQFFAEIVELDVSRV